MGMRPAGGPDTSLNSGLCVCTRVSCAPPLARSLSLLLRRSRTGLWYLPSGRSHAHFDEREMEFGESPAGVEILGMGSQAKIPGMGFETRMMLSDHVQTWQATSLPTGSEMI